jgi:3-oxoacyl-[acyl-carrier protein] reductase
LRYTSYSGEIWGEAVSEATTERVAVITGGGTGIGAATARRLARQGWAVAINYRVSRTEAEETAAACCADGGDAVTVQADVVRDADCRRLVGAALERWGRIDALVNSAGLTRAVDAADLEAVTAEDFHGMCAVNVVGPFQMTRAVAPAMKHAGRGVVVNVSSMGAVTGQASSPAYSATKGALNTLTLTLARTLAPEIRVNCVCPGLVDTRWNRAQLGDARYEPVLARYKETTPLRHALTAEDIADAIVWLIEGAEWVTGEILMVDSGQHLGMAPLKAR